MTSLRLSYRVPVALVKTATTAAAVTSQHCRRFAASPTTSAMAQPSSGGPPPDWSAAQYLKFGSERTRAVHDLVSGLERHLTSPPQRIADLGCGPGNSTAVLLARFPGAVVWGVDSSPAMLAAARNALPPTVELIEADIKTYRAPLPAPELLFSNAVFQWLRRGDRVPTISRLLATLASGGVLAFQVPDNFGEPSHRAMREVAEAEGPWTPVFQRLAGEDRPERDPVEPPDELYDALIPLCSKVDIWRTTYHHILPGPGSIVEWVKGTGLQPFVNALPESGGVREAYLAAYEKRLAEVYPRLADGSVMLRYPRLFVVAVRK